MFQLKRDPGGRIALLRVNRTIKRDTGSAHAAPDRGHHQHVTGINEIETGHGFRCTCQPQGNVQTCQVHLLTRLLPHSHH